MSRVFLGLLSIFVIFTLSGCGDSGQDFTLEEQIYNEYLKNNRVEKYHELQERYDSRVILWINQDEDSWWITNFTLWCIFLILPDLPQVMAGGGVLAIIYGVAWWLGVTLTGGGILAVLAWVGSLLGGIPGIPPAIMGIIYFGVMFSIFINIFSFF